MSYAATPFSRSRATLHPDDREQAWRLTSGVINLAFLATGLLAALVAVFAPWLVRTVIATGFAPDQQALTAGLMRLILLSTLIFAVSGVVMSVLHAHQHFLLPALAPIFVWVLTNRPLVEQFVGWQADQLKKGRNR